MHCRVKNFPYPKSEKLHFYMFLRRWEWCLSARVPAQCYGVAKVVWSRVLKLAWNKNLAFKGMLFIVNKLSKHFLWSHNFNQTVITQFSDETRDWWLLRSSCPSSLIVGFVGGCYTLETMGIYTWHWWFCEEHPLHKRFFIAEEKGFFWTCSHKVSLGKLKWFLWFLQKHPFANLFTNCMSDHLGWY